MSMERSAVGNQESTVCGQARRGFARMFLLLSPVLAILPASAQDTLILKNGRRAECQVLDFTAEAVKISFRPAQAAAGAAAEFRAIPLDEVDYVELGALPGEAAARALAVKEGRSEPLLEFWAKRVSWLGRPRCDAGELGLIYAELLSRKPSPDRLERALKVYQQIEAGDWSAERRGRAQAGRLRVMLRQGRTEEVRPMAEALLAKSGDPRVLIDLRHLLAETAAASLARLEIEHPRWTEEDELLPEHARLKNEALDGYLFPHLFYGTEEDLAARGLWAAVQLSLAQKDSAQASDWALDLTKLYPSSPESLAAAALLRKQPAAPQIKLSTPELPAAGGDAAESRNGEEADEAEAAAPEPPPEKPKRKSRAKPKPKPKSVPKTENPPPAKEAEEGDG